MFHTIFYRASQYSSFIEAKEQGGIYHGESGDTKRELCDILVTAGAAAQCLQHESHKNDLKIVVSRRHCVSRPDDVIIEGFVHDVHQWVANRWRELDHLL